MDPLLWIVVIIGALVALGVGLWLFGGIDALLHRYRH